LLGLFVAFGVLLGLAAPAGAWITGVDVASWQHPGTTSTQCGQPINWFEVKGAGHSFAYVKSTEATTYTNPCFAQDWAGISAAGLYRGSYHYAKPALPLSTARDQARYFVSRTGSMTGPLDLPGFLDLEESGGLNSTDLAEWTRIFLSEVTTLTGKKPMIYTGRYFWSGLVGNVTDIGQQYRLWLPDYRCQRQDGSLLCNPDTDTYSPSGFAGWSTWTFWQNYSVGVVPGIISNGVDMNRFCCDLASLAALAGSGGAGGSPFGAIETINQVDATSVRVTGWAIDPDTRNPIDVHVYPDGAGGGRQGYATTANRERTDVAAIYPGFGSLHGFDITIPITAGNLSVCAYGINVFGGANSSLGCLVTGSPSGYVDLAVSPKPGQVRLAGWVKDPDTDAPVQIRVSSGSVSRTLTANLNRSDVGAYAYDVTLDVPGGVQQACVRAMNASGPGTDQVLGCTTLNLPTGGPEGSVDFLAGNSNSILVSGWAVDPDTAAPTQVHIYVDGVGRVVNADVPGRTDLPYFARYGDAHGFNAVIPASPGAHQVCVYGINIAGSGSNREFKCQNVMVYGNNPFGSADVIQGGRKTVTVAGWGLDPNTDLPIPIHVYVGNVGRQIMADGNRTDVAAVFPGYGAKHGFNSTFEASPGVRNVCIYAINQGTGANQLVSCKQVTVQNDDPFGALDVAVKGYGHVWVAGWALDPKTTASTQVHVYVNGQGFSVPANLNRPDVGSVFGMGSAHGFDYIRPMVGSGPQNVCVYAINTAPGGVNTLIACRTL